MTFQDNYHFTCTLPSLKCRDIMYRYTQKCPFRGGTYTPTSACSCSVASFPGSPLSCVCSLSLLYLLYMYNIIIAILCIIYSIILIIILHGGNNHRKEANVSGGNKKKGRAMKDKGEPGR